jgi:arginyl-tRNA synthetase
VITGDLDLALAEAIRSEGLPDAPGPAGTWRPAPPGARGGPGTYATTIAFLLAQPASDARDLAGRLAVSLRARDEISEAAVTGGGYLTITVSAGTLAALAVRITQAGPACACGSALRGITLAAPRQVDLAATHTWGEAYLRLASEVTGRLAAAAGAQVLWEHPTQRFSGADSPPETTSGPVADSINFAGVDAIRYALCRTPGGAAVDPRAAAAQHLGNPAYAVRYAHAHAASALRQAADLGLDLGEAADAESGLLTHPRERALLDAMSWLPERVGRAARRGRPDVLTGYLEDLAAAYLDGQEGSPAVPPGLPDEPPGRPVTRARLWLAAAAGTALGAGLGLLGVAPPDRL